MIFDIGVWILFGFLLSVHYPIPKWNYDFFQKLVKLEWKIEDSKIWDFSISDFWILKSCLGCILVTDGRWLIVLDILKVGLVILNIFFGRYGKTPFWVTLDFLKDFETEISYFFLNIRKSILIFWKIMIFRNDPENRLKRLKCSSKYWTWSSNSRSSRSCCQITISENIFQNQVFVHFQLTIYLQVLTTNRSFSTFWLEFWLD